MLIFLWMLKRSFELHICGYSIHVISDVMFTIFQTGNWNIKCESSPRGEMRFRRLAFLICTLLLSSCSLALTPDGDALLAFKMNLWNSDKILLHWKEDDISPCNWDGVTCNNQTQRVVSLNLASRKLWGKISPDLGKLEQLEQLELDQNILNGPIPETLGNCSHLKALLLQDNYLSGQIPKELGQLSELKILDMSSNLLSGAIPTALGNLQSLTTFNVSTNLLTGEIPENGVLGNFNAVSFIGNLGLCGQQVGEICKSQLEQPPINIVSLAAPPSGASDHLYGFPKRKSKASAEFLISAAVALTVLTAFVCFWGWFLYHKFGRKYKVDEEIGDDGATVVIFHGDIPYSSKEILRRTELLDETHIIGHGGFGTVYKLIMEDGSAFAVKRIDKCSFGQLFERELEVLGSIKHRNLVNLRGYCNAPSAKLLIYDFLQNGSLEGLLHGQNPSVAALNWTARLKVALGAARGLAYLHHDCSPRIIHRDVKSSNILIGNNFEPYVSDFGLAKLLGDNISHVTTVIVGTFGYLAPEYLQSGRATEKTDVYSYGVVLLELISGKRPSDASFVERGLNIVGWAISLKHEKNLQEILDPKCEGVNMESLDALLQVATQCLSPMPENRPTMHEVVKMLEAEIMSPCPSDFYDSE